MISFFCFGLATHDYIASLEHFPQPNTKVRTKDTLQTGGGNAANVSVAIKRLFQNDKDNEVFFSTKLGNDVLSSVIRSELEKEQVNLELCLSQDNSSSSIASSPFTYILVDKEKNTRTCIHTPGPGILSSEISFLIRQATNKNINAVFLDTRHGKAAKEITKAITKQLYNNNDLMVFSDVEKERPYLDDILMNSTHLFVSQTFLGYYPFESNSSDNCYNNNNDNNNNNNNYKLDDKNNTNVLKQINELMFNKINKKQYSCIIVTCGEKGCLLFQTVNSKCYYSEEIEEQKYNDSSNENTFAYNYHTSETYHSLNAFEYDVMSLLNDSLTKNLNDIDYCNCVSGKIESPYLQSSLYVVYCSPFYGIPKNKIIDTTGAGDAFAGGFIAATFLSQKYGHSPIDFLIPYPHLSLSAASYVASMACTQQGSREGCPYAFPSNWYQQLSTTKML